MAQSDANRESAQEAEAPGARTPLVFPPGDLDAMIFFEEYALPHSER